MVVVSMLSAMAVVWVTVALASVIVVVMVRTWGTGIWIVDT